MLGGEEAREIHGKARNEKVKVEDMHGQPCILNTVVHLRQKFLQAMHFSTVMDSSLAHYVWPFMDRRTAMHLSILCELIQFSDYFETLYLLFFRALS